MSRKSRPTLWTDDETAALLGAAVDRLDDVYEFLFVFQYPIELLGKKHHKSVAAEVAHREEKRVLRTLLLLPVPKSTIMCLFRKKNMIVQGS